MMKYDERLVLPHADGARKPTKQGWTKYWSPRSKFDLMNRLGEYEDTGLTPEEIKSILRKRKIAEGDRVEYLGEIYEVIGFDANMVCLQSVNSDRYHTVDLPLFIFRPDYQMVGELV